MVSKYETSDEEEEDAASRGLILRIRDAALLPFRTLFSPTAQRAYITTILITLTGLLLLGLAITAYTLFYWTYIPRIGFSRPIHLQFDSQPGATTTGSLGSSPQHPWGTARLTPDIVSAQKYDVSVELALPRTRANREAGNFMLEATMYAPESSAVDFVKETVQSAGQAERERRLATSRRPAILSYRSLPVELLYRFSELHWYLLGWRREAETLEVRLWEGVEFARGWRNVPATLKLEVQSPRRLQIYSATARFTARLQGLRWVMYHHRILSAGVFVSVFWATEVVFAGLAWAAVSLYLQPDTEQETGKRRGRVKREENVNEVDEDTKPVLSDTERVFPTTRGQLPLRYESPAIKQEDEEDFVVPEPATRATEADDEDDDADLFVDSGLGTSMESSANRRDSVRRRKSRMESGNGVE